MSAVEKDKRYFTALFIIVITGIFLRLFIAYNYFGTKDVEFWQQFFNYWQDGKNPYDATHHYNYAPFWFYVISLISYISQKFNLQFCFCIKLPLITADILILTVLISACRQLKMKAKDMLLAAGAFFLNPVSVLMTGYHGQFGNISVLFILLAWYCYEFKERLGFLLGSLMLSFSVAVKHFSIMFAPAFAFVQKGLFRKVTVFAIAPVTFIATLLPYFLTDRTGVLNNVFRYNLHAGYWGWSGVICRSILFLFKFDIIQQPWFRYMDYFNYLLYLAIFIASFFLAKRFRLLDSIIILLLIFYSFTTQIAPQYTLWIIPLAAIKRGRYFYWYTLFGTVQLLAFFYCDYHWRLNIPFVGTAANLVPETFIIFRYLTWFVCVLWLADMLGVIDKLRRKVFAGR